MLKFVPLATTLLLTSLYCVDAAAVALQPTENNQFSTCLVNLQNKAKQQGLTSQTIAGIANLKFVPRVIELDNRQPEFTSTFEGYFSRRITDWRVKEGRKLLKENKKLLLSLEKKYGVPPQYLLAFWGMETNFGSYKGKMPVLDSLATLACDPRRSEYFTTELMQALKLKERNGLTAKDMVGSWAGAMGHTQFMPSAYLSYGVDGDGDGQVDLWNSTEDALTSAANFLANLGWKRNQRWGREVSLPKNFTYEHLGRADSQPLIYWSKSGIKQVNGRALSTPDMDASLFVPSGHTGPAFLAYHNFNVMMRWNNSVFYAISVGHLADRINGAGRLHIAPPVMERISRNRIKLMQQALLTEGFDVGAADGILGSKSVKGLQEYQRAQGLIADGFPSEATFKSLGVK